ncbi:hypothetical protein QWE_20458 [Agrobacterium albertimagni AOL15]|uniref:Uncharacterized protein n=1 Tax=Agrobacterium albertimagni AOL15 TaxID=1156935 RepID=K2QRD5_9HYPH|nr:hypothetical protein QWE_20458 [Agrobacterium albertimagni AOL15]
MMLGRHFVQGVHLAIELRDFGLNGTEFLDSRLYHAQCPPLAIEDRFNQCEQLGLIHASHAEILRFQGNMASSRV